MSIKAPPIDSFEELSERKDGKSSGNGAKDFVEDAVRKREAREAIDVECARLALLNIVDYELEREPAAEKLHVRVSTLDKLVSAARPTDETLQGQGPALEDSDA
jgi:hypothetical protein